MNSHAMTRRAFLAAATTTALSTAAAPNDARVVPGKISPNERLNIASIGAGGKARNDIMVCKKHGENIVALCDPDWDRADEMFYRNPDAVKFKDYRVMLDEMPEIDACIVTTPDHTHAPAAYRAMKLGKHVYVQKPLTHTVAEARLLTRTAREMGVATQMGNQGHCGDGVREFCEMIWSGAIGQVKEAHLWTNKPTWPQGIEKPLDEEPIPDTLDWDLWIGTAPVRPYNSGYCPFKWRAWWDFGSGALGDMACHIMDPAYWALKLGEAPEYTVEVVAQSRTTRQTAPVASIVKYQFPARADMGPVDVYWYDGEMIPKRPEGVPFDQELGQGIKGTFVVGEEGIITIGEYGQDARLLPDERMADYNKPPQTLKRIKEEDPYLNWIEACKGGEAAASNFEYSGPFTESVILGNLALRSEKKLHWDSRAGRVTNVPNPESFVSKEYRKGWELPV